MPPRTDNEASQDHSNASSNAPAEKWSKAFFHGRWALANSTVSESDLSTQFAVEGLVARSGTSVWFGNGSIGKTQILLWLASAIGSSRASVPSWLGHRINCEGQVILLSAEDTVSQLHARLKTLISDTLRLSTEESLRTASRIHILPFLSMSEEEFEHPNAGLFSHDEGMWRPNTKMLEIRAMIETWNSKASPDDRIVGVIMDSATSMAGFESMTADAVTNFFFYLNRMCEKLNIFWVVIGHTPKTQRINPIDPDADAASRLRGPAIWTTAPRTTVEVRSAIGPSKKLRQYEGKAVVDAGLVQSHHDLVMLRVAKSNFHDVDRDQKVLARRAGGLFEDLTPVLRELSATADVEGTDDKPEHTNAKTPRTAADFDEGTAAIWQLINETYSSVQDVQISANALSKKIPEWSDKIPGLNGIKKPGTYKGSPREGAVNWHLERLVQNGKLQKDGKRFIRPGRVDGQGGTTD